MFRVTTLPLNTPVKPGENPYAQDFFGKECSLTVSGQLEAEALALGLGKVYTSARPSAPKIPIPPVTLRNSG